MPIIYMFTEQLLQFCLERRGIAWQPAPRNGQVDDADMLFNEAIGNTVLNTTFTFYTRVQWYSADIWNRITHLPVPVSSHLLDLNIFEVSEEIYHSDNAIESTYVFLAVMIDVAMQCSNSGRHQLIQAFVHIISITLVVRLPNGFISSYDNILAYAVDRSEPPED